MPRYIKFNGKSYASVTISPVAFTKMATLIYSFDSEVAWHGIARRDELDDSMFYLDDIIVYPQEVTGGTVNTEQKAYEDWLQAFDDNVFNNIRMHGHSHVNFDSKPSNVDLTHQDGIVKQLCGDMFYIFMIWNKKMEKYCIIYDMKHNVVYDNDDVTVVVADENNNMTSFKAEAKMVVKKKTTTAAFNTGATIKTATGASAPQTKPKQQAANTMSCYYSGYNGGYSYYD